MIKKTQQKKSMQTNPHIIRGINAALLIAFAIAIVCVVATQGCATLPPRPTTEHAKESVDIEFIVRYVNGLNVLTNVLIAVPGLMLLIMGFTFEGLIVILCAVFSCLWHGSGWYAFGIIDVIFASLSMLVLLTIFLRICQIRGAPEFWAFYLILPVIGVMCFACVGDNWVVGGGTEQIECNDATSFITHRTAHVIWHVLTAACFFVLVIELMRVPNILPNQRLADTITTRNIRAQYRVLKSKTGRPNVSIVAGLIADLLAVKK